MSFNKHHKTTHQIVLDIFLSHRDWNASEIYEEYKKRLDDPNNEVTLNAIQKHMESLKAIYGTIKQLDEQWHLGVLDQTINTPQEGIVPRFSITPEAIRIITDIQKMIDGRKKQLTIRQALWVSRLYKMFDRPLILKDEEEKEYTIEVNDQIYNWACAYAEREIICKLNKITFETVSLDHALRDGDIPSVSGNHTIVVWSKEDPDFGYLIDTADPKLKKLFKKWDDLKFEPNTKILTIKEVEEELNNEDGDLNG